MNSSKSLWTAAAILFLVGCTPVTESQSQDSSPQKTATEPAAPVQPTVKATKSKVNTKGWEVTVTGVRSEGQTFKGEYSTYEAVEAWTVVSVTIKNTSGKRQKDVDAPFSCTFSKLIDSKGNEHDGEETEFKYSSELVGKPLSPGESRSEDCLFDTPKGIKATELVLDAIEDDSIRIKL
jgi:hypothetical protein